MGQLIDQLQAGNLARPGKDDILLGRKFGGGGENGGGGSSSREEVELSLARVREIQKYAAGDLKG